MIKILFDCLRAPYDWANILQTVIAVGDCEIYVTGNSVRHDHPKVLGKVGSWSKQIRKNGLPKLSITYHTSFEECVSELKSAGNMIIGTSSHAAEESFYSLDLSGDDFVIVFGTESSGLTKGKIDLMDKMVKLPMSPSLDFMTLSVVVPAMVYEIKRQQGAF